MFCEKGVLKNFIKKKTLAQVFSSEFCEITEHLWAAASEKYLLRYDMGDSFLNYNEMEHLVNLLIW